MFGNGNIVFVGQKIVFMRFALVFSIFSEFECLLQIYNLVCIGTVMKIKVRILRACIFPVATYVCEAWTFNNAVEKRISAFKYQCYRSVMCISWTEKRINISIQKEIKIKENWLMLKQRMKEMKYCGHIKGYEGLEKIIIEGGNPTNRRRERQWSRWRLMVWALPLQRWDIWPICEREREKFQRTFRVAKCCSGQAI
jgi:hypothetical protein